MTYTEAKSAVWECLQKLDTARALNHSAVTREDYQAARVAIETAYAKYKDAEAAYARFIPPTV